jgi:hypothetical protein
MENTGIVRVTVGNEARTLMPFFPAISSFHFNFVSLESPPGNPVDAYTAPSNPSLEQQLTVGSWTLTVMALDSGDHEIARGSAALQILEGKISSVTIHLDNELEDEPGILRYTLQFPDTVTKASLSLASMDGGADSAPVNLLTDHTASDGIITKTGVLETAAGQYLLNVDLYGPTLGNAGKTEAVHIYSNMETATDDGYTFAAGDFNLTRPYQTISGMSLLTVLTAIGNDTSGSMDYTVSLGQHESLAPFTLTTASFGSKKIRIRGNGYMVTLSGTGSLFTLQTGAVLVLQDVELRGQGSGFDNTAALITVNGGDLLMNPGTVITRNSSSSYGGGVYVSSGTFTMSGGTISGNYYASLYSGGVYLSKSTFIMNGGTISENYSSYGGGVYLSESTFIMSGGTISGNSGSDGGGVYLSDSTFTMSGGIISKNYAAVDGGGVYLSDSTFTMSGGTISGNYRPSNGGGVSVDMNSAFTMNGGTISGNSASLDGGGVYVNSGAFTKTGGTVYGDFPAPTTTPQTSGPNANTATSAYNVYKGGGHAVFYERYTYYNTYYYYCNETLADDASGKISTTDTLPTLSGDPLNNWTRW